MFIRIWNRGIKYSSWLNIAQILACSYFFILLLFFYINNLSFYVYDIYVFVYSELEINRNNNLKVNALVSSGTKSTNLKNMLNICMYKLSFCYFYHDEIYLFNQKIYIKLIMIVEMENREFEVKRVTHLKSHRHNYTLLLCYPISFLE